MRLGMLFSVITLRSQKSQSGKRERMGDREEQSTFSEMRGITTLKSLLPHSW